MNADPAIKLILMVAAYKLDASKINEKIKLKT